MRDRAAGKLLFEKESAENHRAFIANRHKYKPSIRKCELCGERYDMHKSKHIFVHPYCPAWPVYKHGELVSLNMYDTEMELDWEIEEAWKAKVRSIIAWDGAASQFKVECWKCGEWFLSEHNVKSFCRKCSQPEESVISC